VVGVRNVGRTSNDYILIAGYDNFEPERFAAMHYTLGMKQTAGTLLYKDVDGEMNVLIVHASGNYNRKAPWSIPKGMPDEGEALEAAARRETWEETGITPGDLFELGFIDYTKSRKRVFCFGGEAPLDCEPRCASWEIDKAEFVTLERACELLHPEQRPFVERLQKHLEQSR